MKFERVQKLVRCGVNFSNLRPGYFRCNYCWKAIIESEIVKKAGWINTMWLYLFLLFFNISYPFRYNTYAVCRISKWMIHFFHYDVLKIYFHRRNRNKIKFIWTVNVWILMKNSLCICTWEKTQCSGRYGRNKKF